MTHVEYHSSSNMQELHCTCFCFSMFQFNSAYADWKTLSPESSQHSRSQARVKEEGCVRFWQTSIKNATLMDLKPTRINSLGRNPLSDALHRNPGVVINGQRPGRHPPKGAS